MIVPRNQTKEEIHQCVLEVYQALERYGYNPVNQLVGYILSGDPTYITAKECARRKIQRIDGYELLEDMVNSYVARIQDERETLWGNSDTIQFLKKAE